MATKSTIAYENTEGEVHVVYCHWDGDVENNGRTLVEHYNDYDLVKNLVSMGAISVLQPRIHPLGDHSFVQPERGTTIFYARDRGDELKINKLLSFDDYNNSLPGIGQHFNYFYASAANVQTGQRGWHLKVGVLPAKTWQLLELW